MKTVPFSDILAEICQLVGLDRITLNDKSFFAVRDFVNKRLGTIWDREDWPETETWIRLFPGNPISSLTTSTVGITDPTKMFVTLGLDPQFPRIYLREFSSFEYQAGTIGGGYISINNPIYITLSGGSKVSISDNKYNFTYTSDTDAKGEYITSVTIQAIRGTISFPTYQGPSDLSTSAVVFADNKQLIAQLSDVSKGLYGSQEEVLEVLNSDPRKSSRAKKADFSVEDFVQWYNSTNTNLYQYNEATFIRFETDGEKWARCRLRAPRLFGFKWSNTSQYTYGAQCYYDTEQGSSLYNPTSQEKMVRGNFWTAGSTTSQSSLPAIAEPPSNVSSNWTLVGIPARFKEYLVSGASADFLRSESRMEEATQYEQLAEIAIQQQIDVLIRQQGQIQRMNMMFTY